MSDIFADRLYRAIQSKRAPVAVGIDPVYERLPQEIIGRSGFDDAGDLEVALDAVLEFCRRVIRIVAEHVPVVKVNSAFFERYFWEGVEGYFEVVQEAAAHGLLVIGDVKRADVGHSSQMYAAAHLATPQLGCTEEVVTPDAVTVNGYFGLDGVEPFVEIARQEGKGVFVLVQTSNPSAAEVQDVADSAGVTVAERLAGLVAQWGRREGLVGQCGFSSVGAVVSPRNVEQARRIREILSGAYLLVPGYGAQGLGPQDVAACFRDGQGAIVAASRSVIYAYEQPRWREMHGGWEKCVEAACLEFVSRVREAVGM